MPTFSPRLKWAALAALLLATAWLLLGSFPPSGWLAPEPQKVGEPLPPALATAAEVSLISDRVGKLEQGRDSIEALRADVEELKAVVRGLAQGPGKAKDGKAAATGSVSQREHKAAPASRASRE